MFIKEGLLLKWLVQYIFEGISEEMCILAQFGRATSIDEAFNIVIFLLFLLKPQLMSVFKKSVILSN